MASLLDDPNDEVVQDSEDEEYLSASLTDLVKASTSRVSSIQTAAFSPIVNKPRGVSPPKDRLSISSFTHTGNSSAGKDPAPVYERPRPRRVMPKPKQDANSSLQSSIADTSMNLAASTSIADFSTSPNMMGIAERAKLRAQNSTKATVSSSIHTSTLNTSYAKHRTPTIIDVIELTSDSDRDELSLSPVSSKSKSKRKLKSVHASNTNKRSKTSHSSHSLRPTSPVIPTLPLFLSSSGLPPSDPPPPTSTYDLPPIAVLENSDSSFDQDVDMDPGKRDAGRGQSPLFSQETEKLVNKPRQARKRKRPAVDDDDDGVNVDVDAQRMPPPALPQPPPTFFAGSSSSVASAPIDGPIETPAASKSIKKRKAKADDDDYSVVDDDGPRPKPAAKAKKPKGKGKKAVIDDNVEVVIEVKAKGKGKGKASAKGKGKGKEKEKEVYKSKEFVNDEDDDDGDFNQGVVDASKIVPSKPNSTISLSSVSESGAEAAGPATTKDVDAPDKTDWMDAAEGESGQPFGTVVVQKKTGKASGTARGKGKGRQVIVSDDEGEDDEGEDASVALEKDTQTKEKPNAKAKGKGKERMPPPPDPDSASDDERASKAKGGDQVVKENIVPNPVPVPVTPKPASLISRYSIGSRTKSTPMSDLIRRVNSLPGSPFVSSPLPGNSKSKTASTSTLFPSGGGTAYSPYLKASKSLLSRIAPLHANIRTPKPPPPPVKKQKTKKEKEREEKWEEEMVESVGGVSEWACMTDAERKEMRRAKWEMELGGYED